MGSSAAATLDATNPGAPPGYVPQETWLQNLAVAVEVLMPSLALIVVVLRAYSRVRCKTLGLGAGMLRRPIACSGLTSLTLPDDYLIFAAMVRDSPLPQI